MLKNLTIDRKSGQPVSTQIAGFIKQKIESGELSDGDKLPTTQEFARDFNIGANTIRLAMTELSNEGLVESLRRRGTFVTTGVKGRSGAVNGLRHIGVMGLVHFVDSRDSFGFLRETSEVINMECNRQNACAISLPTGILEMDKEQVYEELVRLNCDGVVWTQRAEEDAGVMSYLLSKSIPVVASRRFRHNYDIPSVEPDFDRAGVNVANYFYANDIDRVVFFNNLQFDDPAGKKDFYTYTGLKHGIMKGFEDKGGVLEIDTCFSGKTPEENSDLIFEKIKSIAPSSGLVFTDAHQIYQLFIDYSERAVDLLRGRKLVAVSNKVTNSEMMPIAEDLDLMVLMTPNEEIGRMMVGNLMGMIEGYYAESATTLVDVQLINFSEALRI